MNRFRPPVIALLAMILTSTSLTAQLTDAQRAQLVSDLRASAIQLDAARIPDLQTSEQDLVRRIEELRQHLNRSTGPENRDAWLKYLQLDPLLESIQSGASPTARRREATRLQDRLIGTYPGLEVQQVVSVRDAVNGLIPAIDYRDRRRTIEKLAELLNKVADRFENLSPVPSINDTATLTLAMGYLTGANQDVPAMTTIQEVFGRPNARVWIGEPFIQDLIGEQIDQHQPVTDCILGTRITGQAHFVGSANTDILPADDAIRMRLTISGQVASNNVGYNRSVKIRSQGFAGICVTRTVHASESGITFEPTYADVNLQTKLNAIEHRSRLVRRIAWRKAEQSKARADRIATERMRQRLSEQFDRNTRERATAPNPLTRVRPILRRLDLPEPPRHLSSTDDAIQLRSTLRRDDQVSSPVAPPPLPTSFGAVLQLHETAVDNALGHLLAGRTVKETEINELLADAGREMPQEDSEEPPFVIDFASVRPIVFEARDNALRLGVRATRFQQGQRELKKAIIISALYMPTTTPGGKVILTRDGTIKVDFPGGRRLTTLQAGMRRIIVENFSDIMPEALLDRPLKIPSDSRLKALRGREFITRLLTASDGWLTAAID